LESNRSLNGISCCMQTTAWARSRSTSAPPKKARARPPTDQARFAPRSEPNRGRRSLDPLVRDVLPSGGIRGGGGEGGAFGAPLRRDAVLRPSLAGRPLPDHADGVVRVED